jgi:hypothetical protein
MLYVHTNIYKQLAHMQVISHKHKRAHAQAHKQTHNTPMHTMHFCFPVLYVFVCGSVQEPCDMTI